MIGWFAGRTLLKNAVKDLVVARSTLPLDYQVALARELAKRMALVESEGNAKGIPSAIVAAEELARQANRDRHVAISRGTGSFSDPEWLLSALSETWAIARTTSLKGKITIKAFQKVDAEIGSYLIEMLGPEEISNLASGINT